MSELEPSGRIEDARDFAARLEVSAACEERPAGLDDLAPLLALFARSRARQAGRVYMANDINETEENMGRYIGSYPTGLAI